MSDRIEIAELLRIGGPQSKTRHSIDFLVNGESLFALTEAKQSDMCGAFSRDVPSEMLAASKIFTLRAPPSLESGRSLLFVCPECGDVGCGAISVRVSGENGKVSWSDFAYENGYENPRQLSIGLFEFDAEAYSQVISTASHA